MIYRISHPGIDRLSAMAQPFHVASGKGCHLIAATKIHRKYGDFMGKTMGKPWEKW